MMKASGYEDRIEGRAPDHKKELLVTKLRLGRVGTMKSHKSIQDRGYNTDVAVIGSGGGLAAAVAAAERGAKVIVLEKRKVFGGNTAMARALFAAESPIQRRLRIDARKEDLFKASMSFSHWKINPEIIRAFINKSGDTIAWLEKQGVKFLDVPNAFFNQVPRIYHLPDGYGAALTRSLAEKCREHGVTLLSETPAKQILDPERERRVWCCSACWKQGDYNFREECHYCHRRLFGQQAIIVEILFSIHRRCTCPWRSPHGGRHSYGKKSGGCV